MQPTILNKVVSLFLIEGLVLSIGAVLLWFHFPSTSLPKPLQDLLSTLSTLSTGGEAFFVVVGGLALLPLAAFVGATSEAVTDLTIRRLITATSNRRTFALILGQPRAFKLCAFWRDEFLKAAKDCRLLEKAEVKESDRSFAVGMLYGSGQNEAIAWA